MGSQTSLPAAPVGPDKHNNSLAGADFDRYIDAALQDLADSTTISTAMLEQFSGVRPHLLDWLRSQHAGVSNSAEQTTWTGWGWNPFIDNVDNRVGLLTLNINNPIPIHDHPQAVGILVVIEGALGVSNYVLEGVTELGRSKSAELRRVANRTFYPGQSAVITPAEQNIHALKSESESCVVLDILLQPYQEAQRTWYLPVTEESTNGQSFAAFCLADRRTSKNAVA